MSHDNYPAPGDREPDDWRLGFSTARVEGHEVAPFVYQASAEYSALRAVKVSGLSMIVEQTKDGWHYRPVIP